MSQYVVSNSVWYDRKESSFRALASNLKLSDRRVRPSLMRAMLFNPDHSMMTAFAECSPNQAQTYKFLLEVIRAVGDEEPKERALRAIVGRSEDLSPIEKVEILSAICSRGQQGLLERVISELAITARDLNEATGKLNLLAIALIPSHQSIPDAVSPLWISTNTGNLDALNALLQLGDESVQDRESPDGTTAFVLALARLRQYALLTAILSF